jgi:hypothetical protein
MASSQACASCCDEIRGEPASYCAACAVGRNGGPLCVVCHDKHARKLQRFASHTAVKNTSKGELLLASLGLKPAAVICRTHPGELMHSKSRIDGALFCRSCNDAHRDHDTDPVAVVATSCRELLRNTAFAAAPDGDQRDSVSAPVTANESPVVLAVRRALDRVVLELAALRTNTAAALSEVDTICDGLITAITSVKVGLEADIRGAQVGKEKALQQEQGALEAQLKRVTSVVSDALTAAETLSDVDAAVHAEVIAARVAAARVAVEEMPPAPQTDGSNNVPASCLSAMMQALPESAATAVAAAVRLAKEKHLQAPVLPAVAPVLAVELPGCGEGEGTTGIACMYREKLTVRYSTGVRSVTDGAYVLLITGERVNGSGAITSWGRSHMLM